MPVGCYDDNYRDAYGRKPGDRGFVPLLAARAGKTCEEAAAELPEGYDEFYRDARNRKRGDPDFVPPVPTGTHSLAPMETLSLPRRPPPPLLDARPWCGAETYSDDYCDAEVCSVHRMLEYPTPGCCGRGRAGGYVGGGKEGMQTVWTFGVFDGLGSTAAKQTQSSGD